MLTLPIPLLLSWLMGLLSLAFFGLGIYLLNKAARRWSRRKRAIQKHYREAEHSREAEHRQRDTLLVDSLTFREWWQDPGIRNLLIAGVLLVLFTFGGRHLIQLAFPTGQDEPRAVSGEPKSLALADGTKIHAEVYGPADGPILVFTHGWGTSSTEWYYAKRHLSDRYRLILWDLPGLGESAQPADRNFALERMASDLHTVLSLANSESVVLVGHSIGGMINLTFCRLYPELVGSQIAGIAQVDTTYTNPVKTTKGAAFSLAIQKPLAEPILYAMIPLSPFVRAMNWMSYQNGSAYLLNAQSSFAGSETRGQIDLVSRYQYRSSPAVVARGTLAMFHWDATPVLPHVNTPVLIIVGDQDTTTLPSASEQMQKAIPKARLQRVSPSAHYGLLEQNDTYDAALAQFASACLK
jgi:pimeloyl-ACP methyl ester carboxylesterase